jgi:dihydroneopterin aldolase
MENPDDKIFLRELEVDCIIGVNDWERMVEQTVSIDYEIPCDIREAARTDDLDQAIDYKSISKWIIDFVGDSEFYLVETLAERVALGLLAEFDIPEISLTVRKPGAVRHSQTVGVSITRDQDDL